VIGRSGLRDIYLWSVVDYVVGRVVVEIFCSVEKG